MSSKNFRICIAVGALMVSSACVVSDKDRTSAADSTVVAPVTPAPAAATTTPAMPMDSTVAVGGDSTTQVDSSGIRLEVDLTARKLRIYKGQDSVAGYKVAVGSKEWPTQAGEWKITQVIFNPEWNPPDESWAEEKLPRKPGDPKNPLGRAQLVYDPPRTIHGTSDRTSIGKAVSHGSIRMFNEDVLKVGRMLMDETGAGKDSAFFRNADQNRKEKQIVNLPRGVPIRVF